MKQEQDHIKTYSARDIQLYLEGKLSPAEMHALEKAALDDPFLADAIEGFAIVDSEQQNKDLRSLRVKLEKRINKEKKKSTLFPVWMRAAMIVLAVSIGGLTIYNLFDANTEVQNKPIAKKETIGPANADTTTINAQPIIDSQDIAKIETNLATKEEVNEIGKKPVSSSKKHEPIPAISAPSSNSEESIAAAPVKDQTENQAAKAVTSTQETALKEEKKALNAIQQDMPSNVFSGKVLDSKNKPVAGASIMAKNRNVSTVTDINGLFKITAPDTALKIEVASLGYQQNNATLKSNNNVSNNIILQESDIALEEVVVVGYGAQHKKETRMLRRDSAKSKVIEDVEAVEPMGGWEEYDAYINSNKKKPSELSTIDGEVILSFDVNEKHEVSNIKIVKSLSQEQDKEAIRLVKEGPQWKSKKGKKGKAKLAIKF